MSKQAVRCPAGQVVIEATARFRTRFLCRVPSSHKPEDVMAPEYFGLLIDQMGVSEMDVIEVEWEDGTKWGELSVRSVERTLQIVITRARTPIREESDIPDLPDGWTMENRGGSKKWVIMSNGEDVEGGLPTEERAYARIMHHAVHRNVQRETIKASRRAGKPEPAKSEAAA